MQGAADQSIVAGEVLATLRESAPANAADAIARQKRLSLVSVERLTLGPMTVARYRIQDGRSVATAVADLLTSPWVLSAQPNHRFRLAADDDARAISAAQFAVGKLHLEEAHRLSTGRGVLVAVIDSGVDRHHPALTEAISDEYNALDPGTPSSVQSHGTAIAGLIAARKPLASPAPAARILAIRAFADITAGDDGAAAGTTFQILNGMDWAASHGARVVNMSFTGSEDADIARELKNGADHGIVYVAAAGNDGPKAAPRYPAADPHVIAVTATDSDGLIFTGANHGRYISLAAPGVDIYVATPGGGYGYSTGTSMAAAEVSGIAALLLEIRPSLSPDEIRTALTHSAVHRDSPTPDDSFGYGLADAQGALAALSTSPSPTAPTFNVGAAGSSDAAGRHQDR